MTTKGNFKVSIHRDHAGPARVIPNTYAPFYRMKDNDTYSIFLENTGATKCDARVVIDGELIGVWRIPAKHTALVQSPLNVPRRLVFNNSSKFKKTDLSQGRLPDNGKISVEFLPEAGHTNDVPVPYQNLYPVKLDGCNGSLHDINQSQYGTGTTVLGKACTLNPNLVALITDIDHANKQTIDVWLVEEY
jgi:hypothetical protein